MKSLSTLIKLQKTKVDEQRLLLAKLQAQLEQIERALAEHEIRQAREQLAAQKNPESAMTYGEFVRWAINYSRQLERQLATALKAVEIARDALAELFEEQKRYEIAEAARIEEERKEEARQETMKLDEVGSIGFVRKKRRKNSGY